MVSFDYLFNFMNKFSYCWCYDNCGIKVLKILNSFKSSPIIVNADINIVPHKIYPQKKKIHKKETYVKKKKKIYRKIDRYEIENKTV